MGAKIEILNKKLYGEELVADLFVEYAPLEGIDIHSSLVPLAIDEFPIIFIAAAVARGQTRLQGADELRNKESDRITSMVAGLQQLGIDAKAFEDGVHIHGGTIKGGDVDSFHDHRVAMAFAIAGAVAEDSVRIQNCREVATSFPEFVTTANSIGLNVLEVHKNER
jgi:3-phosphoshikimate 1-carboxyvinyltransferase